ncbi:hypothetical protein [Enterococcus ratti]|uniref:Ethanolamine utilization protein n=1 Tax=Enterococcus ratti TaxID=150033 RepID=A0A1L8WPA8_9ENTE|nr:hypothetical protein [Enterococcus ratti]OJG82859.1 ethanolamine utilization protein [Enterococcus ratti]
MKITDIEKLIQKVMEALIHQLPAASYKFALIEKTTVPPTLFSEFAVIDWLETSDPTERDGLVVHQLNFSQMAAIHQLLSIDKKTAAIQSFLFAGKPVLVLQMEPFENQRKMKYHLAKKITQQKEQCRLYGLYFAQEKEGYTSFLTDCRKKTLPQNISKRTYITEEQLKKRIQQKSKVLITSKERLTPLAKDYAHKHQLFK